MRYTYMINRFFFLIPQLFVRISVQPSSPGSKVQSAGSVMAQLDEDIDVSRFLL